MTGRSRTLATSKYLTCESCGEEYDVSVEEALRAKKDGYFICSDCDAQDRIEGFPFTDDKGAFTAVMRW